MKVKINVKDFGTMIAELYPEKAPKTVENFVSLVKSGFYSGLIFHRVIAGFMIQGGGFDEELEHKETDAPIYGEFAANVSTGPALQTPQWIDGVFALPILIPSNHPGA